MKKSSSRQMEECFKWKPPDHDFSKLNIDDSVINNQNTAISFVIRDEDGCLVIAWAKKISSHHISIRALALRKYLNSANRLNLITIQVECDSNLITSLSLSFLSSLSHVSNSLFLYFFFFFFLFFLPPRPHPPIQRFFSLFYSSSLLLFFIRCTTSPVLLPSYSSSLFLQSFYISLNHFFFWRSRPCQLLPVYQEQVRRRRIWYPARFTLRWSEWLCGPGY